MRLGLSFGDCFCHIDLFRINGIDADTRDFGDHQYLDLFSLPYPFCGGMRFTRKPACQDVLDKYKFTENEYEFVATELAGGLEFGRCGRCRGRGDDRLKRLTRQAICDHPRTNRTLVQKEGQAGMSEWVECLACGIVMVRNGDGNFEIVEDGGCND